MSGFTLEERIQNIESWSKSNTQRLAYFDDDGWPESAVSRIAALEKLDSTYQPKFTKIEHDLLKLQDKLNVFEQKTSSDFQRLAVKMKTIGELKVDNRLKTLEAAREDYGMKLKTVIPVVTTLCSEGSQRDKKIAALEARSNG